MTGQSVTVDSAEAAKSGILLSHKTESLVGKFCRITDVEKFQVKEFILRSLSTACCLPVSLNE